MPISAVSAVTTERSGYFLTALLSGAAIGAAIGAASYEGQTGWFRDSRESLMLAGAMLLGIPFSIIGAIAGIDDEQEVKNLSLDRKRNMLLNMLERDKAQRKP